MNKNLKRTIALALAIGTISAVAPATSGMNENLLITKAYADDGDENEDETLDSLKLESSNGDTIKLYSDDDYKSDDRLDNDEIPSDDETYYAKTNYDKVQVKISGPKSKYVKVFKGTSKSTKGKSTQDDISLTSDTTKLIVRVYNNNPDEDIEYDDDADKATDYEIEIKHTDSDTNLNSADDYDDIYLEKLSVYTGIDTKDISLSESKIDYSCNVDYNIQQVILTTIPDDDDNDDVTIDGDEVNDTYKKKVSLNVGENKFKIKTENHDNNDERVYTLTINRAAQATVAATGQSNTATAVATTTVKVNQWVPINGRWQYNDSFGHAVANKWQAYGASWYYLGADGYMQTNSWVTTGGKYYYLNGDGSMAVNTTISGYKVGSDGAWTR